MTVLVARNYNLKLDRAGKGFWLLLALFIFSLLLTETGLANPISPPAPMPLSQTMDGLAATPYVTLLEDPSKSLTLEDVRSDLWSSQFETIKKGRTSLGFSRSSWWVRLQVKNSTDKPIEWLLQSPFVFTDFLDFYQISPDGSVRNVALGDLRPFDNRPIPDESFVIPMESYAGESTLIYIRFSPEQAGMIDTQLLAWSFLHFGNHRIYIGILKGWFFGSLLFIFVYNFFIYVSTRRPEYLWNALFLLGMIISNVALLGLGHRYLYHGSKWLTNNFHIMVLAINFAILTQFSRSFLKTDHYLPRGDKLLKGFIVASFFVEILLLFGFRTMALKLLLVVGITILVLPFFGGWVWYSGVKQARFYVIAWGVPVIFLLFHVGWWFGLDESSLLSTWGGRIGLWLQAMFLSLALADYINILSAEREEAISREQTILIQARNELEEKVQERTRDLETAKRQADNANAAKGAFLATMSHEIRTPINGIIGMTHLVLNTTLTQQQQGYLNQIHSSTRFLLEIINNILDFSKIDAGHMEIEKIPFNLDDMLENLSSFFTAKIDTQQIDFTINKAEAIPRYLVGDPLRLKQVLTNLVGNAVKFTSQGRITLEITLTKRTDCQVVVQFMVKDSGIGMSAEQLDNLFRAFTQADSSTTRKYGGSGLGLSICQRLVEQMGGELDVSSQLGKGSSFLFYLEFDLPSELFLSEKERDFQEPADLCLPDFQRARVLLVEDNPVNQQVARELLEGVNLVVSLACNGLEAVEMMQRHPFDLILMDIQMPKMDGYQATTIIRNEISLSDLPIIAMTANAFFEDQERCLAAGMNDHVAKPVEPNLLYRTLTRWLPSVEITPSSKEVDPVEDGESELFPKSIPGINLEAGLRRVRHNQDLLKRLLREFCQGHKADAELIRQALEQDELEVALRIVHTLKGTAGSLGAYTLSQVASTLETAIKRKEQTEELLQSLEIALNQVTGGVNALLARDPAKKAIEEEELSTQAIDLTIELQKLATLLQEATPQASDLLPPIKAALIPEHRPAFIPIEAAINNFQFDNALEILKQLCETLDIEII